ncbi:MAG: tetratricopeptide repeat protein [Desulfobacterales bacterium]|nr:tetratricopeptide repeat protein [Desulfobacterales bacterium]
MGLFKLFSGKRPEDYEAKGDARFQAGAFGDAKLEFEAALEKCDQSNSTEAAMLVRLHEKLTQSKEALAQEHKQTGENLLETGGYDDAMELFTLAAALTEDQELKKDLEISIKKVAQQKQALIIGEVEPLVPELESQNFEKEEQLSPESADEYFGILCAMLPLHVQKMYLAYDDVFKDGYVALNQGDFETAVKLLGQAHTQASEESYISLELATAYFNLGRYPEAQSLLESFIHQFPDALPGYELLCEIYWKNQSFNQAEDLLARCPQDLVESVALYLLKGETFVRANQLEKAKALYHQFISTYGWNDQIMKSLAYTHEALGETENARQAYSEILDRCKGCGARVDVAVKHRYANLCFASGERSNHVLELYFDLIKHSPQNAAEYYDKISRIYTSSGNEGEAQRYRAFAQRLTSKVNQ